MVPKQKQETVPAWLWLVAGAGVVIAVVYAVTSSGPVPAPSQTPPPEPIAAPTAQPTADPRPDASFDEWVHSGNHAMDAREFDVAIRRYSRALELDSTAVSVWVDRGACEHALGNEDAALADFGKALGMDPDHLIARFNTGIAYYTSGRIDSARIWWETILRDAPESNEARRVRQILSELGSSES